MQSQSCHKFIYFHVAFAKNWVIHLKIPRFFFSFPSAGSNCCCCCCCPVIGQLSTLLVLVIVPCSCVLFLSSSSSPSLGRFRRPLYKVSYLLGCRSASATTASQLYLFLFFLCHFFVLSLSSALVVCGFTASSDCSCCHLAAR